MHNNNHSNPRMMWMMLLGCLLLVGLILILGGTGISKNWLWLGAIVLMFGMHAMMMTGHGHSDDKKAEEDGQLAAKTAQIPDSHKHN